MLEMYGVGVKQFDGRFVWHAGPFLNDEDAYTYINVQTCDKDKLQIVRISLCNVACTLTTL